VSFLWPQGRDFLGCPASTAALSDWLQAVVGPLRQKSQKPCNQSPPFCHVGVFLPAADRLEDLLARDIDWSNPEDPIGRSTSIGLDAGDG